MLFAALMLSLALLSCDGSGESAAGHSPAPKPSAERSPANEKVKKKAATGAVAPGARAGKTRVVMLGSGTPVPDPDRSGPAVAVLSQGRAYLVDMGPGVVRRAAEAFGRGHSELDVTRLSRAFLTHLHSDHTAGYADLIFTPATVGRAEPLEVYGPRGTVKMTENLLAAYAEDMKARRQGKSAAAMRGYRVQARDIKPGKVYQDPIVTVTAFAVEHGSIENALGYRFDTADRSIVISGDTAPTEAVVQACDGCDLLLHEVYCQAGFDRGAAGWQRYHATHHTSSLELGRLATRARPGLLVLYHLLFFDCPEQQLLGEVRQKYTGPVVMAEDLVDY
jgi:ribonuclease BN (tRNA processing enzyme)